MTQKSETNDFTDVSTDLFAVSDIETNLVEDLVSTSEEGNGLQQDSLSLADTITFDPIKEKIEEARVMAADLNVFTNNTSKQIAERAIRLGLVLLEIKSFVRKSDEAWEEWADEHLTFIGERNRQKFMMLAKRLDCHQHTYLGLDRLEKACVATKADDGENPIGSLLTKYAIVVDETSEFDLEEFRAKVDVALNKEKLQKRNIPVSLELVNDITRQGKNFDDRLLKKLSNLARAGEDPEAYLKGLSTQGEKDESEPSADVKLKGSFNSLANKMIEAVDYLLKNPDQISKIDPDSFHRLLQKLIQLQAVANIDIEQAKAA
jgi:hypothetical protein